MKDSYTKKNKAYSVPKPGDTETDIIVHPYRTHTCGELRIIHINDSVRCTGWIHRVRDHGGIVFIDLRDHYGITQIVIKPEKKFHRDVHHWRLESVITFTGIVVEREKGTINTRIATGKIEIIAEDMVSQNQAAFLPFPIADEEDYPENTRLAYRFLELRRQQLHDRIMLRSRLLAHLRDCMMNLGFHEIQTPILTASSPEGARDFLVPSRLHPGKFYALPQAPQLFKQLLMVSGFDRYFQIAPCFRDEDARADRSPGEFYQLDMEMSFATQDDVFAAVEHIMKTTFQKFSPATMTDVPFPRIPYRRALKEFGNDKPDLRNPLRLIDVTSCFEGSQFRAFANAIQRGAVVRAIKVKGIVDQPRKFFDNMIDFTQSVGGKGLAYIGWKNGKERSPIAKFLSSEILETLKKKGDIEEGDVMFFICDQEKNACSIGASVLKILAERLDILQENTFQFCWITDYPMFEADASGEIQFSHNPFSMPQGEMEALLNQDPLDVLAYQYDLVCNGVELSSGAIRSHRVDILYKTFEIAGYTKEEVNTQFRGLIQALQFGAPPHGGIAPGIERILMLLTNSKNIREVVAFPMNQQAQDVMMNAPSNVSKRQLKELNLQVIKPMK